MTKKRCEDYITGKETINIDFHDQDIIPIFRLLADISGCNMVIHPAVRGKITIKLIDVPWNQFLDITLKMFGLGKSIEGNIITIAPLAILHQEYMEKVFEAQESLTMSQPLETKVYHINYSNVSDLEVLINKMKILSIRGSLSIDKRTNILIIKDIPAVFKEIESILTTVDKPVTKLDSKEIISSIGKLNYDAFICHASEDKESFVRELADRLTKKGLHIWYDEFSLKIGDSLRRSIDKGLLNSRFGIVVLSHNFFKKKWPQRELDGLTTREVAGENVILPIWHDVSKDDVSKYSPVLADRVAVSTKSGMENVVKKLIKVIGIP